MPVFAPPEHEKKITIRYKLFLVLFAFFITQSACLPDNPINVQVRTDLNLTVQTTHLKEGLSDRIYFDVPDNTESMLIEVRGKKGFYSIVELVTPKNQDLLKSASFPTRGAIQTPGLVDWIYPNSPVHALESGTYMLSIMGRNAYNGNRLSEEIEVLVYTPKKKPEDTCGINIDLLIDDAVTINKEELDEVIKHVNTTLNQVGIKVKSTYTYRLNMQSSDIDLGTDSAIKIVDKVLNKASGIGVAREGALHVIIVRRIGGTQNSLFDPAGYSMGLPGPYSMNRNTAAVLISTELFSETGSVDVPSLASTMTHELGHYMGLYHTSERTSLAHDPIADTPQCIKGRNCSDEFRQNIMTSSTFLGSVGLPSSYRTKLTPGQGRVMRGHPICMPMPVPSMQQIVECTLACKKKPKTCAVLNNKMTCIAACDPDEKKKDPCKVGTCQIDDLGTYVCL